MCHVPNNTKETIKFENNVRALIRALVNAAIKIENEVVPLKLELIGSFSSDTKIIDLDELIRLLVYL